MTTELLERPSSRDRQRSTLVSIPEKPVTFMGDRMCDLVLNAAPPDLIARPARSFAELKAAFKLIYMEYLSQGYCQPNEFQMHYSPYSILPTSRTFILKKKRALLGTISLIVDSPCGLPMESTFPELIHTLRAENSRKLAEVSLLTLNLRIFREGKLNLTGFHKMTVSFWLFKTMLDYARYVAGATDLVITVHPKHESLYRAFSFKPIANPASYESACGNPGLPMHLNIEELEKHLPKGKNFRTFFFDQDTPTEVLNKSYEWTSESLQKLLHKKRDAWLEMSDRLINYIENTFTNAVAS